MFFKVFTFRRYCTYFSQDPQLTCLWKLGKQTCSWMHKNDLMKIIGVWHLWVRLVTNGCTPSKKCFAKALSLCQSSILGRLKLLNNEPEPKLGKSTKSRETFPTPTYEAECWGFINRCVGITIFRRTCFKLWTPDDLCKEHNCCCSSPYLCVSLHNMCEVFQVGRWSRLWNTASMAWKISD